MINQFEGMVHPCAKAPTAFVGIPSLRETGMMVGLDRRPFAGLRKH